MKIAVIPDSNLFFQNRLFGDIDIRDDILAPYKELKSEAEKHGWSVATFDQLNLSEVSKVLAVNYIEFPEMILEALNHVGSANLIGIVREPPGIAIQYYDKEIQKCFGQYYAPVLPSMEDSFKYLHFPVSPVEVDWIPYDSKKMLVSLTSGKLRFFSGNLYEERIKAIKYFQQSIPDNFDMYGQGWKKKTILPYFSPHNLFPSYKGSVKSKHETLRHYRFSLCYENCENVCGYVSEKVFDSIRSGCVPIYLGAPDIQKYIPKTCFIDKRDFTSYKDLQDFICNMHEKRYLSYMDAISDYLNSDDYLERVPEKYAKKLILFLKNKNELFNDSHHAEGLKKLKLIYALKLFRNNNIKDKFKAAYIFFLYGKLRDWIGLILMIFKVTGKKLGIYDIYIWIRIRKI